MTSIAGGTLAAASAGAGEASGQTTTATPEHYVWRQYLLRNGTGPKRLADYLQNAAIPALNRLGHSPVGAFEVIAGVPGPTVFLLVPLPTLASLGEIEAKMRADQDYLRAAAPYLDATAADPVYVREETSLLAAFPKFPTLAVPAATASKGPRVFELRTYESPTEKAHLAKVKMFSELGEIEIFKRVGLNPVFFSRTMIGPRMPSLVYMLVYDDMAGREKSWTAFRNDPEWKKLSAMPGFTDPEIVSNITAIYLRPAAYSQI
ncbi:MAG: NIPSNAP family protein [Vicinamibacterales bacterium]